MIHQIETINRLLISLEMLRADIWANEEDVADYYRTQYIYPIRDTFESAKEFGIETNLVEAQEKKLRLTKLGKAYLRLEIDKERRFLLEPNVEQKFFLNKNVFLEGALSNRIKELLSVFKKDESGNLWILKSDIGFVKDKDMFNLLLQSGFLTDKNQIIIISPEYAREFLEFISQIPIIVAPEAFERIQKGQELLAKITEKYALDYEQTRLKRLEAYAQSKNIDYVAAKNVAAGYDISSFNNKSSKQHDRFIEVKAGEVKRIRFFLTRCEFETAKKLKAAYWIYYIYIKDHKSYKIHMFRDPIKSVMHNPKFNSRVDTYEIFEI